MLTGEFGSVWTDPQRLLAEEVASVWVERGQWPTYQWIDHYMRRRGLDPLETLLSFPTIGGARGVTYADVRYERSTDPDPGGRVRLTVSGLARMRWPMCRTRAEMFLDLLHAAVAIERDADIDPVTITALELTSDQLAERLHPRLRDQIPGLYEVFNTEPLEGFGSRGDGGPDGSWHVAINSGVRVYQGVEAIGDYLEELSRQLTPPHAPPAPRVLPSPVSLATALGYLDVTWELHAGRRLFEVTDLAGLTSLAFEAGNEDEFRGRCSALMDLLKNMHAPGVPGFDGHPLARLRAYLAADMPEEDSASAAPALSVLDSLHGIRIGQQHADRLRDVIPGLNELGVAGPPFDWTAAWSTVRERVTLAALDLQATVGRLPRQIPNKRRRRPSESDARTSTPHQTARDETRPSR